MGSDNDSKFDLMDNVMLGVGGAAEQARELRHETLGFPAFPMQLARLERSISNDALPVYGNRCERHCKTRVASQVRTCARCMSTGELFLTHTRLLAQSLPVRAYYGEARQSE